MISLDFETRSRMDITECGAYRYAEDPSTEILVIAVSENGGPVRTWDIREPYQGSMAIGILRNAIDSGDEIHAFNSQFEWAILKYAWTRQFGYPAPDINNMRCTQAVCRHGGLPPSLAACAEFLNLEVQKDKLGKSLIRTFSIPQKADDEFITHETPGTFTLGGERRTYAEAFQMFVDYCRRDVETEMAVSRAMKPFHLKGLELGAFLFTARMNDRGVPVDVTALRNANRMFVDHEETLTKEFMAITGFTPNQNARVLEWMQSEGYPASSLDKKARASFNGSSFMSEKALRALGIKSELSFAAVKKVPTMLKWVMSDGRIRGSFKWCGAQKTGRWTSEGPQWQNMKKPEKGFRKVVDTAYDSVTRNVDIETMELCFGNPYETIASLARYFVRFPDCNIFDLDFAQVEARILPMLIECDRILESFLGGSDIYTVTATAISKALKAKFGVDEPLTRDHGKTIVLATQFNGGWNAVYNATGQRWKQEWCEEVVRIVRKENPEFPAAWRRFQDTMLAAFDAPDRWHRATKYVEFAYTEKPPFPRMYLRLPSGRKITWPHPKRDPITMVRVNRNGKSKWERIPEHFDSEDEIARYLDLGDPFLNPGATLEMSFKSWDISFYGHVEQGHYGRVHTSGGDALQSATQGTGVELLTYGAMEAEKNGFLAFLLVHDQGLFPAIGDRELMEKCLCSVPDWFAGFPLEAEADVVRSYCKQ